MPLFRRSQKVKRVLISKLKDKRDEKVRERELRSLESVKDNYEKTIITTDKTINNDYNGIKVVNIIDFLLDD